MKAFQAILIFSGILIIAGIYVIYPPLPVSNNLSANIPAGNYYYRITFNILKADHISGTFSTTDGSLNVYVFTSTQFASYQSSGQTSSNLYQLLGVSNGPFAANVESPGNYYVVFEHVAGSTSSENVQISYVLDGWNPIFILGGIVLIAIGVALGFFGRMRRSKTEAPRKATDVVMFDQHKT